MEQKIKKFFKNNKFSKNNKFYYLSVFFSLVFLIILFSLGNSSIVSSGIIPDSFYNPSSNIQLNDPDFSSYSDLQQFNQEDCENKQDFIIQIAPGGCSPMVVRSDLLEEQNVPVFCKLSGFKINPLVDISKIRSLYFEKEYPPGVSSISYFPSRKALNIQSNFADSILEDNLGYLVVVLSKNEVEREMPDYIEGNISAVIHYDSENSLGIGENVFYLSELDDFGWNENYKNYGFWNGKAYIRVESIEKDSAKISIYQDIDSRKSILTLKPGQTSRDLYLDGFYCSAGFSIELENIDIPRNSALLQINDEKIWVGEGDEILNGKCRIRNLEDYGIGGRVNIDCSGSKNFDLTLSPIKAEFKINGGSVSETYSVGDKINLKWGSFVWVGYIGKNNLKEKFVVLVKEDFSQNEDEFNDKEVYDVVSKIINDNLEKGVINLESKIENGIKANYKKKLGSSLLDGIENIKIGILVEDEKEFENIQVSKILISEDKDWSEISDGNKLLAKEYYDKAIEEYNNLFSFYPSEKEELIVGDEEVLAAKALYESAKLSKDFEMSVQEDNFYNKLIENYPDSLSADDAKKNKESLGKYDFSDSEKIVEVNNQKYFINLLDFKKPKLSDLSAVLLVNSQEKTIGLNQILKIEETSGNYLKLVSIEEDEVKIIYHKDSGFNTGEEEREIILSFKEPNNNLPELNLRLLKINLNKQVKVKIIPKNYGTESTSDFKFKIGIEKRAIQLSPEKTQEMIEKINNDMTQWQNINDKLGQVVKGLKASCFATSAILTIKNLFSGMSGEAMARTAVMTNPGGWNDHCAKQTVVSVEECLLENNAKINEDIKIYKEEIEKTNKIFKDLEKNAGLKSKDVLGFQKQVDSLKFKEELGKEFKKFCEQNPEGMVGLANSEIVSFNGENSEKGICDWNSLSIEEMRNIMTLYNVNKGETSGMSGVSSKMFETELQTIVLGAKNSFEIQEAKENVKNDIKESGWTTLSETIFGGESTATKAYIETVKDEKGTLKVGDKVISVFIEDEVELYPYGLSKPDNSILNNQIIIKLEQAENNNYYTANGFYSLDGVQIGNGDESSLDERYLLEYLSKKNANRFVEASPNLYKNSILNSDDLIVKYFEQQPYKGLPAEVPFDIENGWYVHLSYVLSGFGQPYDDSGRVINYYICNVGENGLINFKEGSDDICRYYNGYTTADLNFPESKRLISQAQQAIKEAAEQYGEKRVRINGKEFDAGISFDGNEGRCTDFMSPADCNLLFNVCDPVICPASRCDLGGKFRVDNVIQSGILGSLVLCLPNFPQIKVPICLSGVHAGIENYVSILNSTQQCLNESLKTGKTIGICDEIKSIYLCEFFWKQASPLLDVLGSRLFENIYSQGVKGGGEYLSVESAWQNTENAIDYFKNNYAVNSMKAFQIRSTEEIGTEFCKAFISGRYPNSVDFFDNLIEPDSPTQYSAWFSEDILTTATVPPTSHYKVYYHIYSGKDQGVQYVVYLKDLPESNYIYTSDVYIVDRGYAPKASQVDITKDFKAVSGYKQLCVSINGQEQCGFGEITTNYFLNALSDKYVAEQIKTDIETEEECVAGSSSLGSLLQPNLQSGVEELINPEIYNEGIIRVCASENPGKQVDENNNYASMPSTYDRWKEVGICGDSSIKCWLDTNSVKQVIKNTEIEDQALEEVDLSIFEGQGYFEKSKSDTIIEEAQGIINSFKIDQKEDMEDDNVNNIDKSKIQNNINSIEEKLMELSSLGTTNFYRAKALFLLGNLYKKVAEDILKFKKEAVVIPPSTLPNGGEANAGSEPTIVNEPVTGENTIPEGVYKIEYKIS